jgi:repressor LexA
MKANLIYSDEQVIFITNDTAMMPQLMPGSMLAGQYVETVIWAKQCNGVYAIILDGGMVLIRRIRENDLFTKGILTLHSDNPVHPTQTVMADDIHSMYIIQEIMKQAVI